MDRRKFYIEALEDAADVVGGPLALSRAIGVPLPKLTGWLSGKETPPLKAFLAALDVMAERSYAGGPSVHSPAERSASLRATAGKIPTGDVAKTSMMPR